MTELDRALVRRKLATITRDLDDLAEIEGMDIGEFSADRFRQKGTERFLQEVIEAAVDVNLHLLRVRGRPTPSDYFSSFIELGEAGAIPSDLAKKLAPSTGLRNRLVHEYDAIDDEVVLEAVSEARELFGRYVAAVEAAIERG